MVIKVWKQTFSMFKENPKVVVPFFIVGFMNALALFVIYLAPQRPVSIVLAPIIRAFWGEQYLHYPVNLSLVPKLYYFANILIDTTIGVLMTGLAIGLVKDAYFDDESEKFSNFWFSIKKYLSLVTVWLIIFGFSLLFTKLMGSIGFINSNPFLSAVVNYFGVILVQLFFLYPMVAIVIDKIGIFRALGVNFVFLFKNFIYSFLLVAIPALLYIPVLVLQNNMQTLMKLFSPDVIVFVLGVGIFVILLINSLITVAPVILYLNKRKSN